ncbi:MAG: DUF3179 domain-containing protein [Proteobacteria bacterium]|nr:DUF3179 domain-containing protein [Pseudomonadota bacterium]
MRLVVPLFMLGCAVSRPVGLGPSHTGIADVENTTYQGEAYLPSEDDLSFVDVETGSRFNLAGQAFEGELADDKLQLGRVPGVTAFWFAWSTHHPGARVWQNGVNNEGESISGTADCGVPCSEIVSACFGGRNCIPSIDSPDWRSADDSLDYLVDDDRVLGIARDGLARAYPLDALWRHEIVNDTWGEWEFSVTYCPLTGSGVLVDGEQEGTAMRFGVSGNLYNSNLVLFDRSTDSLYGQMRQVGFSGERLGSSLQTGALIDTTWGQWRTMYPSTEVLGERHAGSYPYGDYREDDTNIFADNNPDPDPKYPNKSYAIGVIGSTETVIYAFDEMESRVGELAIVEDMLGDLPILVAFDARTQTAVIYSRRIDGVEHSFTQ